MPAAETTTSTALRRPLYKMSCGVSNRHCRPTPSQPAPFYDSTSINRTIEARITVFRDWRRGSISKAQLQQALASTGRPQDNIWRNFIVNATTLAAIKTCLEKTVEPRALWAAYTEFTPPQKEFYARHAHYADVQQLK